MKLHCKPMHWLIFALTIFVLTACRSSEPVDNEARIETRVAEELAVAATLTARAAEAEPVAGAPTATPTVAPATTTAASDATDTPAVVDITVIAAPDQETVAATAPPPTATPLPATATPIPPTAAPAATATPVVIGFLPVDGDDGNDFLRSSFNENQGRVVLFPGFAQNEISAPMVFRDRMAMRIEIFDTRVGLTDGAGIQQVTFTVEDADGDVVHTRTERTAGYCIFGGGEPDCNVLNFAQANFRWPDEGEIFNGDYLAKIDIDPENGDGTQWRVEFAIDIPGRGGNVEPPAPAPNTARINNIREEGGRYIVEFDVFGFVPTLPGQHLHFFWNTVPPEQAGVPGGGPWQLYPASNGASGVSPFTMFGVNDRPNGATQICVLVANANHSVNQGTGNCADLP